MLAQLQQVLIAHRGGCPGYLVGKMNYGFVFFVEEVAAMVEREGLDLLLGNADPLRRSGVRFGSILATVHDRGFQVGEFLVAMV